MCKQVAHATRLFQLLHHHWISVAPRVCWWIVGGCQLDSRDRNFGKGKLGTPRVSYRDNNCYCGNFVNIARQPKKLRQQGVWHRQKMSRVRP